MLKEIIISDSVRDNKSYGLAKVQVDTITELLRPIEEIEDINPKGYHNHGIYAYDLVVKTTGSKEAILEALKEKYPEVNFTNKKIRIY